MYVVVQDTEAAYTFCREHFPIGRSEYAVGLCLKRDDQVIAAVIYDQNNGQNIFADVAAIPGRKWLNRWFLHEAFKYPFVTLGLRRMTGIVEKKNVDVRRFLRHLGFTQEATLECAAPDGGDLVIYRLLREECRYA